MATSIRAVSKRGRPRTKGSAELMQVWLAKDLRHKGARLFEKKGFHFPVCRPSRVAARRQVFSWETSHMLVLHGWAWSFMQRASFVSEHLGATARLSMLSHCTILHPKAAAISMSWRPRRRNVSAVSSRGRPAGGGLLSFEEVWDLVKLRLCLQSSLFGLLGSCEQARAKPAWLNPSRRSPGL